MDNETLVTDLLTRAFQQMTLAQAEELVNIKRRGLDLTMNASSSAQLEHQLESRETVRDIVGQCLAKTRRGEQ